MQPLIKYPGWKERESWIILSSLPKKIINYYEPFVWWWAIYFAMDKVKHHYINDKSEELILLYTLIKKQDQDFFSLLEDTNKERVSISDFVSKNLKLLHNLYNEKISIEEFVSQYWNKIFKHKFFPKELTKNLKSKLNRMKKLEQSKWKLSNEDVISNIECAIRSAFYMTFRTIGNKAKELKLSEQRIALCYFLMRNLCYSSMFRYNANWEFNVPYGWISYNSKDFSSKINYYKSEELHQKLMNTDIYQKDFYDFVKGCNIKEDDFMFLDPPYDTEFSTYAWNEFWKEDQIRLANYLIKECKANFMIVIKNTDFIRSLYKEGTLAVWWDKKLHVKLFDKHYMVSFQDRNDKDVEHLLITNYQI